MEKKIKEIVKNFDPNKKFSDEDKAFAVRNAKFSATNKQKMREERQQKEKVADKSYYTKLAMKEKLNKDVVEVSQDVEKRRSV